MNITVAASWKQVLNPEFEKPYFNTLVNFVNQAYSNHICYPPENQIFNAFDACGFDNLKVVILGQDPYHGAGQANGLCFSVNDGIALPPSLLNIFKELQTDLGKPISPSGNLERWAQQGVLLLNATLTVTAHQAGSHQNRGWEQFTDAVIQLVSQHKKDVVFILWGSYAQKKSILIDASKHLILKSVHPSPLSSYRGFFGCKHFSKTNEFLLDKGFTEINW